MHARNRQDSNDGSVRCGFGERKESGVRAGIICTTFPIPVPGVFLLCYDMLNALGPSNTERGSKKIEIFEDLPSPATARRPLRTGHRARTVRGCPDEG